MSETIQPTSGRPRRSRSTQRSVRLADGVARTLITLGGLGTILAVSLVCVFLVWVVIPLFLPGSMQLTSEVDAAASGSLRVVQVGSDEYRNLGWLIREDGRLTTCQIGTGQILQQTELFPGRRPVTWSFSSGEGIELAVAFADGTVQLGRLALSRRFWTSRTRRRKFVRSRWGKPERLATRFSNSRRKASIAASRCWSALRSRCPWARASRWHWSTSQIHRGVRSLPC